MTLQKRIELLVALGNYCTSSDPGWEAARRRAHHENGWFTPEFIDLAVRQIAIEFLQKDKLIQWAAAYRIPETNPAPKNIGLIMAGNIPLVGFHDFLCIFISGHRQTIKPSSRDKVLITHLIDHLATLDPEVLSCVGDDYSPEPDGSSPDAASPSLVRFSDNLKGCDGYIATGSNNSARYFDYYFSKFPHIIRRNRTSVAVITGQEDAAELSLLADDVYQYFGLGCRNVTKLYLPANYDFIPLLTAFRKYDYLADLAKYQHNYIYQLTILLLNTKFYMSNASILLSEEQQLFSPISVLHYEFYPAGAPPMSDLSQNNDVQCIVSSNLPGTLPFGNAQRPGLMDYADGVDTLAFLKEL